MTGNLGNKGYRVAVNAKEIEKLIALLEAKDADTVAFDGVTFGTLLAVARMALDALGSEEGVDSAHSTRAEFEKRNG